MRNVYELISAEQIEADEIRNLYSRTEKKILQDRVRNAERRALAAEREIARQKKIRQKEKSDLLCMGGMIVGLGLATASFLRAPWWTGIAPLFLIGICVKKVGWF